MGSAAVRKLEGFVSLGGEVPFIDPCKIMIVGLDLEQTDSNWFAFCPRAKEEVDKEFVDDIRTHGVRTPVDVYRDGDTVVMLDGRRRVRAARIVYAEQVKERVPVDERIKVRVQVRSGPPAVLFQYNVGSQNRKELSPLQTALLMQQAKKYDCDDDVIARMFSCSKAWVRQMLSVFDLDASVQRAVDEGAVAVSVAVKLKDKPREEQKKILAELKENNALKGAAASNGIAAAKRGEKVTAASGGKMRSRGLLERWRDVVKKDEKLCAVKVELSDVLKFVLGGSPSDLPDRVQESLTAAGYKVKAS